MADDPRTPRETSAELEPWWPDFVENYGKLSLREMARRYSTNTRRLRRAAHRSGLSDEPEAIRENTAQLSQVPDEALAEELGVTVEAIAGARRRRRIAPIGGEPAPVEPAVATEAIAEPSAEPSAEPDLPPRGKKKRRFTPASEVVVVHKGRRERVVTTGVPAPLASIPTGTSLPHTDTKSVPAASQPIPKRRPRCRIVKPDTRPGEVEAPVAEEPKPRVRRKAKAKPPPVRIVFDRRMTPEAAPPIVELVPRAPAAAVGGGGAPPPPAARPGACRRARRGAADLDRRRRTRRRDRAPLPARLPPRRRGPPRGDRGTRARPGAGADALTVSPAGAPAPRPPAWARTRCSWGA